MPYRCLYSPIKIGAMEVPNRFVVPPMGNNFANSDGSWSDQSRAYYEARAAGGFGLITVEATVVHRGAKGGPLKPCLYSDDSIPSLRAVVDACHRHGAKVSVQLQTLDRRAMRKTQERHCRRHLPFPQHAGAMCLKRCQLERYTSWSKVTGMLPSAPFERALTQWKCIWPMATWSVRLFPRELINASTNLADLSRIVCAFPA